MAVIASGYAGERNARAIDTNYGNFQGYDYPAPNKAFTFPP